MFINLKPLTIQRLKAYRKSLKAKAAQWELCDCGSYYCDNRRQESLKNPRYVKLRTELMRTNKELARKQQLVFRATLNPAETIVRK